MVAVMTVVVTVAVAVTMVAVTMVRVVAVMIVAVVARVRDRNAPKKTSRMKTEILNLAERERHHMHVHR